MSVCGGIGTCTTNSQFEIVAQPEHANRVGGIFVVETPPEETALKLREALGGDPGL